jgi:hypothetical protein
MPGTCHAQHIAFVQRVCKWREEEQEEQTTGKEEDGQKNEIKCFALHRSGSTLVCVQRRGTEQDQPTAAKSRRAGHRRHCCTPVRLYFDVLAQHVEPHLLAHFYVVFQGCVSRCCIDAIWPKAL